MYLAAAFLDPDTVLTRAQISEALMARFRQIYPRSKALAVQPINNEYDLLLYVPRFHIALHHCDPGIAEIWRKQALESIRGSQPDPERIRLCRDIYLIAGGREDPDMRYFNDYITVLEVLESLGKLHLLDRNSFAWI